MRQILLCMSLMAATLCTSCGQQPAAKDSGSVQQKDKVLWRSHFVGGDRLAGNADAARWVKIAATPASHQLRDQTLHRLGTTPFRALNGKLPAGAKDQADVLQPLLADLLNAESFIEWRGTSNRTDQFALAIKLTDDRAKAWNTGLATVFKAWAGLATVPFTQGAVTGWQIRKAEAPNLFGVARVGGWVVVGMGQDAMSSFNAFINSLKTGAAPFAVDSAVWGEVWADWKQLEPRLPFPLPVHPPQTHLTIAAKDNNLRINGSLDFESALNWRPQQWRVPEGFIREPLISFTAARGVTPLIQQNEFLRQWKFKTVPDELYVWAVDGVPFTTFFAAPTANAAGQISTLAKDLQARYNPVIEEHRLGSILVSSNGDTVNWRGLPIIVPYLSATKDGSSEFILGGLFPNNPKSKPPPAELFDQVKGHKNLAYYDWELTDLRLKQWKVLTKLYQIVNRQPMIPTNAAAVAWLTSVSTNVGNTVTEINVSGDRQMTLTRKAPLGLTAFELVTLTTWMESTNFPLPSPAPSAAAPRTARPAATAKPKP